MKKSRRIESLDSRPRNECSESDAVDVPTAMSLTPSDATPLLLDINASARFIGVGIGVIRGWVSEGLPFVRAGRGGKKMFDPRDLKKFVEKKKETVQ